MEQAQKNMLLKTACKVRMGVIEGTTEAKSGHPGGSLSAADIITYLYFCEMNVDPKNPKKADRDRFVLSKGHGSPALYSVLALKGFFDFDEIKNLRKIGGMLQGHPDMNKIPGIDMSTGSLGQGISAAAGMALSAKVSGDSYRVYTLLGDGELEEGQVWEAAMFAAHKKLDNLIAFVDNNDLQIDGNIADVNSPKPIDKKFEAFGWAVFEIDGHDFDQIEDAVNKAKQVKGRPSVIIAKTVKGKGVSFMENVADWHGKAAAGEQAEQAMAELKSEYERLA